MRIVLKHEKMVYVLEGPIVLEPPTNSKVEKDAYKKRQDDVLDVSYIMLATMNSRLQKQHKNMEAFDMIKHPKMP